ncbi:MAG: LytR C-terminal domain-containing protein [Gemmatimonadales bacterium]
MRARTLSLGLIGAALLIGVVALVVLRPGEDQVAGHAYAIPSANHRILVEVLNGTDRTGLARDVTRRLRAAGLDVITFGNATAEQRRDTTRILVRRGDSTAADPVRQVLGLGRTSVVRDTLLRVDITVILGPDYIPQGPFHP